MNVSNIPIVERHWKTEKREQFSRWALICFMGERMDLSSFQIYWLNKAFHDRPSDEFSFEQWVIQLIHEENGLSHLMVDEMMDERLAMCTWDLTEEDYTQLRAELRAAGQSLEEYRGQIETLLGLRPIGYTTEFIEEEVYLDIKTTTIQEIVGLGLMKPITAAKYFMITRPCEHVVLTPTLLRWANRVPSVLTDRASDRQKLPTIAPDDLQEYLDLEYIVRRHQRVYFPNRTSLEAHLIINEAEKTYEAQPLAYQPNRLVHRPLYHCDGSGI